MVISSTLTTQLEIIRAPVPLSRTRPRSVPVYVFKSPTTASSPSRQQRKRSTSPKKFAVDKPPFINFASAYIDPYVSLTPVPTHRKSRSRYSSRSKSQSSRQQQKQEGSPDNLNESSMVDQQDAKSNQETGPPNFTISHKPIHIKPLYPNAFDPRFCQKRQMIIDNPFYRETVSSWKPTSISQLVTLIKDLTLEKNVIDRVWLVYYWIAENILYDIDADFHSNNRSRRADEVFRTCKTTCDGYASIFKALCDGLHIPCLKISGYTKDYSFKINKPAFYNTNHTWNVVQLNNNYWYLIDSSWGTGYIDGNHEYKKEIKPHYFLTQPEHMIYNHLPEEPRWQLLEKPITMNEYIRLPHIHSYYFIYGLNIIYPRFSSIVSFEKNQSFIEVLVQAPNDIQITCSIKNDVRGTSLAQYDLSRQLWQCLFAPNKKGFHTLIIYASRMSTMNLFTNVIELGVYASFKDIFQTKPLPITFGKFTGHKCQLLSPLNGFLQRGTKATIRCRIPDATCGRISIDGIWLDEVPIKNDMFKQQVNVPERELILYAKFNSRKTRNNYDGLVRYMIEK